MRPPGASQPTGTGLGPSRTLPASLFLSVPANPPPQERRRSPSLGSKACGLSLFLSSFLPSLIHSFKPFNSGPDTKLALGIQQRTRQPHRLLQGAHGLSRKHSDTSDCYVTSTKSPLLSEPHSLRPERTWVQCSQDSGVPQPGCKSEHTTTF